MYKDGTLFNLFLISCLMCIGVFCAINLKYYYIAIFFGIVLLSCVVSSIYRIFSTYFVSEQKENIEITTQYDKKEKKTTVQTIFTAQELQLLKKCVQESINYTDANYLDHKLALMGKCDALLQSKNFKY